MELFWRKGYTATSIQDLVSHLGINRASLYDTYGGKDELFSKAFDLYRKENTKAVENFLHRHTQVKEGFKALFDVAIAESIADTDRKGCFVVNTTTELIPHNSKMLVVLETNKKTFEQIFHQYLETGELAGQFKAAKDLKSLAALLFTLYNGLKVVSKLNPEKESLTKTIATGLSLLD